jgi:hypothetical protein
VTLVLEGLLASVVAERRLSVDTARPRSRFTLARDEALLRLRGSASSPHITDADARSWLWTLALVRAATIASDAASGRVLHCAEEEGSILQLCFALPGATLADLDLSGLLHGALEPDRGSGDDLTRIRRLLGRAINGALGADPRWVELRTQAGSRRWERSTQPRASTGGDPYVERVIAQPPENDDLVVVFAMPRAGWARALGALFSKSDPIEEIDGLWHRVLLGAGPDEHVRSGLSLVPRWPGELVELGTHASWCRVPRGDAEVHEELAGWNIGRQLPSFGIWLVRDGVLVAPLAAAFAAAGLDVDAMNGFIDCPALALTVDEATIVEDEAFEALVAWMFDALAHTGEDGSVAWSSRDTEDPSLVLQTASGAEISVDALGERQDVLFVWRHRVAEVPAALRNRVLALWPSHHRWLRMHREHLRLVPLHALGRTPGVRPADLTDLVQGSFAPVPVPVPPFIEGDGRWPVDVRAYVQRHGLADKGLVVVLAYGRRVGFVTDSSEVIAGVSVVIELQTTESSTIRIDVLQDDVRLLRRLVRHAVLHVRQRADALIASVLESVGPEAAWSVPHVQARVAETSPWSLGLRYVDSGGTLSLRWSDSSLTQLLVGKTLGGQACSLADALTRARDVGGVVTTEAARRWQTLESNDENHRPWILTARGRELVERTLGTEAMWDMPVVAEAQPHVASVASQPALQLDASEVARLRSRATTEPSARTLLVAHALVSAAGGRAVPEIEELPLLRHYDPRAITPGGLVSLAAVRELAAAPGLVPVGAVDRSLETPVVEAPPALAALLAEVAGLAPARGGPGRSTAGIIIPAAHAPAVRKGGRREEPLVTVAVVDRLAAGALTLERIPARDGITLWARGLRVGSFRLPSPLRDVTGRLWLTDAGVVAGHAGIHALASRSGIALARAAVRTRLLTPPATVRRRALETFLNECREAVAAGRDRMGVGPALGWGSAPPPDRTTGRLPQQLGRGLALVVRHALQQPVMIETALLSRTPARLADPAAWPWRLRLGRRHPWIRRGLRDDAQVADVRAAACLVVAEAIRQAGAGGSRLTHACLRLLGGAARPTNP